MSGSDAILTSLNSALEKTKVNNSKIALFIAANIKDRTENISDYSSHSIITEYFTEEEIEDIVTAYRSNNIYVDVSGEESDFIAKILGGALDKLPMEFKAVYSSAQKGTGPGRKSLIPSFCNMLNIPILGSNAYVRSLCRHKYHTYTILKYHGLQKCNAWLYDYKSGWLSNKLPDKGTSVIIKPIYESASIGIDQKSIFKFDNDSKDLIKTCSFQFSQPIIVQEFICGYEVEVPVINISGDYKALGVVGISIDNKPFLDQQILTYDLVYNDLYSFYNFEEEMDNKLVQSISNCAESCCKIVGIEGLGRIDFRVTKDGSFFVTDVATNPHITKHSSYWHVYKRLGFDYSQLPLSMLAIAAVKHKWF